MDIQGIKTAIGVDLSGQHLTIVRGKRARAEYKYEILHQGPVPQNETSGLPTEVIQSTARMDTIIAACMPANQCFARWLHAPLKSVSKARKVLPSLLDIQLPFPIESCIYTFVTLKRNEDETVDALAVAARREDIEKRLDKLKATGLTPERLDHEGLALWTLSLRELPIEKGAVRVIAYLGATHSTLVIGQGIPENGTALPGFISAHSIRVGLEDFNREQDHAEQALKQFALRAQQILRAQTHEIPAQWIWTGPGADDKTCPTRLQDTLHGLRETTFLKHKEAVSFLARALAYRSLNPDAAYCNLLQKDLAHPKTRRRAGQFQARLATILLTAGIFLTALAITWQVILHNRETRIRNALGEATEALTGLPAISTKGQEVILVTRALEKEATRISPFQQAFSERLTHLIGAILKSARANDILLESLSIRKDSVSVRGAAKDWDQCGIIADLLKTQGFDVELNRHDAGADERVHFIIQATRINPREDRS